MENTIEYNKMVEALAKSGHDILKEMDPAKADLVHMGLGITGEAGELADAIKKHTIYGKPLDVENVIEELGDLEFYMEKLRQRVGITRTQTLVANQAKLSVRYSKGSFSNDQAQVRADKQD